MIAAQFENKEGRVNKEHWWQSNSQESDTDVCRAKEPEKKLTDHVIGDVNLDFPLRLKSHLAFNTLVGLLL